MKWASSIVVLASLSSAGCLFTPAEWSPDGRLLVFATVDGDANAVFRHDWLWPDRPPGEIGEQPLRHQVWAHDPATGNSRLIVESTGVCASPTWAADGRSVFVVHYDATSYDHPGTLRLKRFSTKGEGETIIEERGAWSERIVRRLSYQSAAASPDGLWLAVPWLQDDLVLVNLQERRLVRRIPGGCLPSWSPDSQRLAYFSRRDPHQVALAELESGWNHRPLLEMRQLLHPPVWEATGLALQLARPAAERHQFRNIQFGLGKVEILRVNVTGEPKAEIARDFSWNADPKPGWSGCYFARDKVSGLALIAVLQDGCVNGLSLPDDPPETAPRPWDPFLGQNQESQFPVGAPSFAPGRKWMSLRYGIPEWSAPVAIYDFSSGEVRTVAPNDAVLMRALWNLAEGIKRVVRKAPADAPSPFRLSRPIPAEVRRQRSDQPSSGLDLFDRPMVQRQRRKNDRDTLEVLSQHGLELIEAARYRPHSTVVEERLAELKLLFAYVRQDYAAAGEAINRLLALPDRNPVGDRRITLAVLRSQCLVGQGKMVLAELSIRELLEDRRRQLNSRHPVNERLELRMLAQDSSAAAPSDAAADPILQRLESLLEDLSRSRNRLDASP